MTFPTTTGTKRLLAKIWSDGVEAISRNKEVSTALRDQSATGPVISRQIWNLDRELFDTRAKLIVLRDAPGMEAYARAQINDNTFVLATEATAVIDAIDALRNWINTNMPKDANGWLLDRSRDAASATFVDRLFGPTTTAGLRTQIDAFLSALD